VDVVVGEVAVFGAAAAAVAATAALSLAADDLRRLGSWTSLPACHMKRRSCHGGEDMMVVVDDRVFW